MQDSTALRVEARYVGKKLASGALAKGDRLTVWMKKGPWMTEIRRGTALDVREVRGDAVDVNLSGWAQGGWAMTLPAGQDPSAKFTLQSTKHPGKSLVVKRKT